MSKTIVLIPARLKAKRLPFKPLLKIKNYSLVQHVYNRAVESGIGDVIVATGDKEIADEIKSINGNFIITKKEHNTGTDRIYEAFQKIKNKEKFDYIINLQGDEPFISPKDIFNLNKFSRSNFSDIATLAYKIKKKNLLDKNIVKLETLDNLEKKKISRVKNFFRYKKKIEFYKTFQHIGIYQYKTTILKRFVGLKQSKNELTLSLEQYRALDNGILIDAVMAKKSSMGIDTIDDYMEIKKIMEYKS
tara:strand:+ start:19963 stop:20703 length:741 start_codon:yes stop_codon:yes gene_type:complete